MAYKFQFGQAILSGALDQEGDVQVKDQSGNTKIKLDDNGIISGAGNFQLKGDLIMSEATRINAAGAGSFVGVAAGGAITTATDIDGSGDLTMGTITMTGFTVDADGDMTAKSLVIPDDSTIGAVGDTDMITLDAGADVTFASDLNVVIGKAGGLNLADGAVTSTAAELNLVDGSSAGSIVNSKAVIYGAAGQIVANELTGTLRFSLDVAANGGLGMTPFANSANVNDLKISGAFMQAADVAVAADQLVMLDADGSVKRESFADYATAIAGDGLAASAGVLSVSLTELTEAAVNVAADSLIFIDADGNVTRRDTFSDYATLIAGDGLAAASGVLAVGVDDSSIELNSDALRIKADGVTGAMLAPAVAGVGLAQDGSGNLDLDLNELSAATVNVAADSIAIIDADDSNGSKKESIADLVAGMAGAGLAASGGQLSVQGNTVTAITDGTAVVEGYNFCTGSTGGKVTLPASPSVGDVVTVKLGSAGNLTLEKGSADHRIDGEEAILLESPFSAVTCVYMVADAWRIV
tara:strand:+ start:509 stop:2083 length:1575 start_codon:yes stop_codon:yes gene_type:complete